MSNRLNQQGQNGSAAKIRVLIVEASALMNNILRQGLALDRTIDVVETALDAVTAQRRIVRLQPDVVILNIEMPRMDSIAFLSKLMSHCPVPVIVVSSATERGKQLAEQALANGAVDWLARPGGDLLASHDLTLLELSRKVKNALTAGRSTAPRAGTGSNGTTAIPGQVIVIGASTGGTEAIRRILEVFPADAPATIIVQHMPGGFTRMFAERLNQSCAMQVKEAEPGEALCRGLVLIAPGGSQCELVRSGAQYRIRLGGTEKVSGHCPSIDVLMHSVARHVGSHAIGAILTGMGKDGAQGLHAMYQAGGRCIAQDDASSVVFGMPRAAYETGGAERLVPLHEMAAMLLDLATAGGQS
ncbi:MAG: chemotaxis-specific protein-glutamate methyltransferase CheB [Pelovirga sp.]